MECVLAGSLLFSTSSFYLTAYIPLLISLYRLSKSSPSFIIFLSSSIGDWTGMLQLAIFGVSLLIGIDLFPNAYPKLNHSLYELLKWAPMQFHYVPIAVERFCAIVFYGKFEKWFGKKNGVQMCFVTWAACLASAAVMSAVS